MNLLAVDTSTEHASVALSVGDQHYQLEENTLNRHAEWIVGAIESLLRQADVKLADLQGIVFGQGPGSFTGLRIACSVAKGLAMGASLPLYPVSGLVSIEAQISADTRAKAQILTVLDARMQAWYWAFFAQGTLQGEIRLNEPAQIELAGTEPLWIAGVGFEALQGQLPIAIQERLVGSEILYPSAVHMIERVRAGHIKPVDAVHAAPLYVRDEVASVPRG